MATARSIRADELEELLDLYRMLNPDDPPLDPEADAVVAEFETLRENDFFEILVVEHDDRLVASCVLSITPNLTRGVRPCPRERSEGGLVGRAQRVRRWAVIENVVTHEEHRGQGYGSRVLEYAVGIAEDADCYKVMLLTGTDAEWKLAFYEGCGFDREDKTGFVQYLDAA